jgi:putative transposase
MRNTRYKRNAGAVFSLKYHLVWCPKYRLPVLTDEVRVRLLERVQQKAHELGAEIHASEVMPDHVHLFIEADPTFDSVPQLP